MDTDTLVQEDNRNFFVGMKFGFSKLGAKFSAQKLSCFSLAMKTVILQVSEHSQNTPETIHVNVVSHLEREKQTQTAQKEPRESSKQDTRNYNHDAVQILPRGLST